MDDLAFKQKYKKYKLRVKLWETDFKKKHGRIPSKYDIREASQEIRDSYKMYYKLKTSFLEDTLNDALADDGFDISEISQSTGDCGSFSMDTDTSFTDVPHLPMDIAAIVSSSNDEVNMTNGFSNVNGNKSPILPKEFEVEEELKLNQEAWGDDVSKRTKPQKISNDKINNKQTKVSKPNLNVKFFKSSLPKRNPRKSLSRINSETSLCSGNINQIGESRQQQELLPDLETILTQKAKEQQQAALAISNASNILLNNEKIQQPIKNQLDEGWLQRNIQQNDTKTIGSIRISSVEKSNYKRENPNKAEKTYGLSNIDLSKVLPVKELPKTLEIDSVNRNINVNPVPKETTIKSNGLAHETAKLDPVKSDSDSVVSESGGEEENVITKQRAKRRRLLRTSPDTSKSNIEEINANILHPNTNKIKSKGASKKVPKKIESCDKNESKDEKIMPEKKKKVGKSRAKAAPKTGKQRIKTSTAINKPKTRSNSSKQECDENCPEDGTEYNPPSSEELKCMLALDGGSITSVPRANLIDLKTAEAVANRYINTVESIVTPSNDSLYDLPEKDNKTAVAKRNLEAKIASGRLNENFVRINIERKRYVRGKKSVNYSRYKKKLWKDKKRVAALSGPDMDMGGCDGGVLKCFTCGQVGHFAQNCKIKGDNLLPLTVQIEDESPFPTLEEVAQMASKSATVVHSKNISKLPIATNVARLFNNDEMNHSDDSDHENELDDDNPIAEVDREQFNGDKENFLMDDCDDNEFLNIDINTSEQQQHEDNSLASSFKGYKIPEEFLRKAGLDKEGLSKENINSKSNKSQPLYDLNDDGTVQEVTSEVIEALHMFGHTNFRKGQDRAIMRILSGLSTLVTLSTGSGKSLCYQLPAYIYSRKKKSITLVVSPLVSLMEDQVTGVPHFLRAHCLHTNQTKQQRLKTMQMINDGEVDILLVSPEAVVSGERSTGFGAILRQLPPIAFACIDEAHCVSQWSHNFRPSYLMICKVLKKNLGIETILGLTATATLPTRTSIIRHLGIKDGEDGIISDIPLPDNLILSISKDRNRDAALLQLLNSERFQKCQSIIVYCTRREECERIAGFLRTSLQDYSLANQEIQGNKKKRKRSNWQAEPYHAGMPASRRRTVQNAFMKNELRIVVATIAFGMGINKPDIRAIIHYNMPKSFESYVQEIGRSGRDGKISHCHLFLDSEGNDQNELRRHIFANSIDRHVIRKLLQNVFVSCSCAKNLNLTTPDQSEIEKNENHEDLSYDMQRKRACPGHEIGFSIEDTVEALDIPAENISTLLCYMELDNRWNVNVLSSAYMKARIISYGGAKYLKHAARDCPPLAMAIALEIKKKTFKENESVIEFPVVDIAAAIGWNSGVVKHQLKNLEWINVNGLPKRSPLSVQFIDLGFRVNAPGDLTVDELDEALDTLYERSVKQEKTQLIQLQYVFQGLSSVGYNNCLLCTKENFPVERSEQLKGIIRDYFANDYPKDLKLEVNTHLTKDQHIIDDIHAMINMYPENKFSGRTIARIFHGISSPNYPAIMWGRCKYWRAHSKTDFNHIVKLANPTILSRRT